MNDNIYDEKGILKPEYELSDAQRRAMNMNDDNVTKPLDNRTDFGKGIYYLTCDGKKCSTMEEVIQYNDMFYKSMMINPEEKGMRR